MLVRSRQYLAAQAARLRRSVSSNEWLTLCGGYAVVHGVSLLSPAAAWIVAGVLLLWIGLPPREGFIVPPATRRKGD